MSGARLEFIWCAVYFGLFVSVGWAMFSVSQLMRGGGVDHLFVPVSPAVWRVVSVDLLADSLGYTVTKAVQS
nr:hypothetical protein GCM10017611_03240 [Rhodococcus wratislaviensis]